MTRPAPIRSAARELAARLRRARPGRAGVRGTAGTAAVGLLSLAIACEGGPGAGEGPEPVTVSPRSAPAAGRMLPPRRALVQREEPVIFDHVGPDSFRDVAVDAQGAVYAVGATFATPSRIEARRVPRFDPADGRVGESRPHRVPDPYGGGGAPEQANVLIVKLDPRGDLEWSVVLGGPGHDRAYAIELDAEGALYVAGRAGPGFPTTEGVVQPEFGGDRSPGLYGEQDAFVAKLSPDGEQILWSTYIGSDGGGFVRDLALDSEGFVHLAGTIAPPEDPTRFPAAVRAAFERGFRSRPAGWTSGPTPSADNFVIKLAPDARSVAYATFLGGEDTEHATPSIRIASHDEAVVSLYTLSSPDPDTMPVTRDLRTHDGSGRQIDVYVARLARDGSRVLFGTLIGGDENEAGDTHNLAIAGGDRIVLGLCARSTKALPELPPTCHPYDPTHNGNDPDPDPGYVTGRLDLGSNYPGDAFVFELDAQGALVCGTYFGGREGESIEGVAIDDDGAILVTGGTQSADFPTTPDAVRRRHDTLEGFLVHFDPDLGGVRYSTLLGPGPGVHFALAVDQADGLVAVVGSTGDALIDENPSAWIATFVLEPPAPPPAKAPGGRR